MSRTINLHVLDSKLFLYLGAGCIGPLTVFAVEQVLAGYSDNYRKVGVVKMGELSNSTATGLIKFSSCERAGTLKQRDTR